MLVPTFLYDFFLCFSFIQFLGYLQSIQKDGLFFCMTVDGKIPSSKACK